MLRGLFCAVFCLGFGLAASAGSLAGVCPDGSAFIVKSREDVPCPRAKFVAPSELPPLRPELLPRPYNWYVDQQTKDPHNPYNLIDDAAKIRALREGQSLPQEKLTESREAVSQPPAADPPSFRFAPDELRELNRLLELSQRIAPAAFLIEDVQGHQTLQIRVAYSPAFEVRVLERLEGDPAKDRILAFSALARANVEFHPNFFVVQDSLSYRPDPSLLRDVGFLNGSAGELTPGATVIGYFRIPAVFDPSTPLELWWNDRSLTTTLRP